MTARDIHAKQVDETHGRTTDEEACPECDGTLVSVNGETSCTACGLVAAEDRLDRGPEWRSFEAEARARTGPPLKATRHDRGLSTEIGLDTVSSGRKRRQLARLRTQHERAKFASKAERNLATAFGEIARMTGALDLSHSTRERASAIYRRAQRESLIVGRSIEALAAGSVYAAIRCTGTTRTLAEVASAARCSRDKVELGYGVLNRELGFAAQVTRPPEYVPRVASAVEAPDSVRRHALELARPAEVAGLASGCRPGGVAAACVYLAGHEAGQLYTQQELADVVDVTPTTLRKQWYALCEELG